MMLDSTVPPNIQRPFLATISASDFFKQINWSGLELSTDNGTSIADSPYETVGQFFATFPWQDTTTVLADDWKLVRDDELPTAVDDDALTLEDLSALF